MCSFSRSFSSICILYDVLCFCILLLFCFLLVLVSFFFFKQKTAYEMRISDWSSDVCSSDLHGVERILEILLDEHTLAALRRRAAIIADHLEFHLLTQRLERPVEPADEAVEFNRRGARAGGEIGDRQSTRLNSSH